MLSNRKIKELLKTGDLIITDFKEENLNKASYDLTLGDSFWRSSGEGEKNITQLKTDVWGGFNWEKMNTILSDDRSNSGIILQPNQTVLGHSHEFAGCKSTKYNSVIYARSTAGRFNITACRCAGFGDPGYFNRWTLEIQNCNPFPVFLPVGSRICQIVFFEMNGEVEGEYSGNGQYQKENDLETIMKVWEPKDLLPKSL